MPGNRTNPTNSAWGLQTRKPLDKFYRIIWISVCRILLSSSAGDGRTLAQSLRNMIWRQNTRFSSRRQRTQYSFRSNFGQ